MKTNDRSPLSRRTSIALTAAAFALTTVAGAATASEILAPTLPGQYAAGSGANATFLSIDGNWRGTQVYWKEPPGKSEEGKFSNKDLPHYDRIGDLSWGTGIWGLVDWHAINDAGSVPIVHRWSGVLPTINQGDTEWAGCVTDPTTCGRWGVAADPLPTGFFGSETPQNNWTSRYSGYIRITEPGEYNFGVLYDDGFFLNIFGADGSSLGISSDFLSPRDRLGFTQNIVMSPGLYEFELGAYDRLQVGVVNLSWLRNGQWTTVPTENLVTDPTLLSTPPIAVPTPGTAALLVAGLGALAAVRMKRKRG